jgi:hypothetical protein
MKTQTAQQVIRLIVLTLLILACLDGICQTKVRDLEIVSTEPYEIFVIYPDTLLEVNDTVLEYEWGWKYNEAINFDASKGMTLKTAFVTCLDTTFLTIHGGEDKFVSKGGVFTLNGQSIIIGNHE